MAFPDTCEQLRSRPVTRKPRAGQDPGSGMAWLQEMNAVLVAGITTAEGFAAAAWQWLTQIPEQVFPGLFEGLRHHPVVGTGPLHPAPGQQPDPHYPVGQLIEELGLYGPAFPGAGWLLGQARQLLRACGEGACE